MPLKGTKGNISNLNTYTLQRFQLENIAPDKITIGGAGIESHQEFVDLVADKLSHIASSEGQSTRGREKSEYTGGEIRNLTDDSYLHVGLVFESVAWNSPDVFAFLVLANIIGLPGQVNPSYVARNVLKKHSYIDQVEAINANFTDSGLFGIRVTGSASNGKEIVQQTVAQLRDLTSNVSNEELERAKTLTKLNILINLERQQDRLEEVLKSYRIFGN
jgi:predicted Zn-dependent peptidase